MSGPYTPLAAGEDNHILHTVFQILNNRELFRGPLRASRRPHHVAHCCLDPTAQDDRAARVSGAKGCVVQLRALLRIPRTNVTRALYTAAQTGHANAVRLLLRDERADPCVRNSAPLVHAALHGHTDVVRLLLEDRRADPTAGDSAALRQAALQGHADVVRLLLEDGRADPTAYNSEALGNAAHCGSSDSLSLLLEDGRADLEPLRRLLYNDRRPYKASIMRLLLEDPRTDLVADAPDALASVCRTGDTALLRRLLRGSDRVHAGPDIDEVFARACGWGILAIVHTLLQDGRADPRGADALVRTVHAATVPSIFPGWGHDGDDHVEIVALLLEDGRADPREGRSEALRLAVEHCAVDLVRILLQDGRADPRQCEIEIHSLADAVRGPEIMRLLANDGRVDPYRLVLTAARRPRRWRTLPSTGLVQQ